MNHLCAAHALAEGQSRGFAIDGIKLFTVRRDGQVYAYRNQCPHRGTPLDWTPDEFLDASRSLIRCAQHGALFLIDSGECVAGPCAGQALQPLACSERDGAIWVEL
ncbi:Rieske (2Fe-2S) protein [Pseudomonas sp. UL073]|uniref:Rieske (2Fe-2S) protein n=1 Tax=Zestomonas insulae TaxID=2809017 RepID=A0ABS2IK61_9GAMM|nr:Rieske (2Fe-2S) protein [Pseudomonas insulae]MBM7063135.1 Rieske (2Fe-2S) protein [Pseudomonas insulae]